MTELMKSLEEGSVPKKLDVVTDDIVGHIGKDFDKAVDMNVFSKVNSYYTDTLDNLIYTMVYDPTSLQMIMRHQME